MTIEPGDYFAITRGFRLGEMSSSAFIFAMMDEPWRGQPDEKEKEPRYDRSFEGLIFKANEVCGVMIASRCVATSEGSCYKRDYVGKAFSINTSEVEVWPLTEKYAAPFLVEGQV